MSRDFKDLHEPGCGGLSIYAANLLFLVPSLAAPTAALARQPLARVNVDLVQVEVVVTDSKGNRITDLRADEMEVFENGRPRRITHFSFIPELRGEVLPQVPNSLSERRAESASRRALSLELRTALSLADLRSHTRQRNSGLERLAAAHARSTVGFAASY